MNQRKPIATDTIEAVAAEFAGQPVDGERAVSYRDLMEPIYQSFETLRGLPLKDVEPAVVFTPVTKDDT